MKVAVVEGDIQIYRELRACLEDLLGDAAEITYYSSGEAFLEAWKPGSLDVIILDISMDGLTGVEAVRTVRGADPNVKIVFISASNAFASESYEVNACYYLRKPLERERVEAMVDRLEPAEMEKKRAVKLPDGTSVLLRRIIYADCASHFVTFHMDRQDDIVLRAKFSEMEKLLCTYPYFVSPIKGVIINFHEVIKQTRDIFIMSSGTHIPISRRKMNGVLKAYASFLLAERRKD